MKIQELIDVFEKLIPIYEKGSKEATIHNFLGNGICYAANNFLGKDIYEDMNHHYQHFYKDDYIFPYPEKPKDLLIRSEWMKGEIPYLKGLVKKGYTDL